MAVDAAKIKERLKVLFPGLNLSQKRLDELSAKLRLKPADNAEDTVIDTVINDFNDITSFEDIAKEDDRVRGLESKAKKIDETKTPEEIAAEVAAKKIADDKAEADRKALEEAPPWAKQFMDGVSDKIGKVSQDVSDIKSGKITETKTQQVAKLFGDSQFLKNLKPEHLQSWVKRVDLDSDTPIEDQIGGLEKEYEELVQSNADSQSYAGGPPKSFAKDGMSDDAIGELVDGL